MILYKIRCWVSTRKTEKMIKSRIILMMMPSTTLSQSVSILKALIKLFKRKVKKVKINMISKCQESKVINWTMKISTISLNLLGNNKLRKMRKVLWNSKTQ